MAIARWLSSITQWGRPDAAAVDPTRKNSTDVHPSAAAARPPAPVAALDPGVMAADTDAADASLELTPALRRRFTCWLLGQAEAPEEPNERPVGPGVRSMLEQLDHVIGSEALCSHLLPRAQQVVPQLMKTLRDEGYSTTDVAARISKDVVLTAEVIRNATSAYQRGNPGSIDLARAVAVVGTQGLRRAIASVVLRPLFEARGDTHSARAAPQLWTDADKKARLCAALAVQEGADPFDGYLAGLLHDTGWSAALRAIDGFENAAIGAADLLHPAVVPQLERRRDALFGALVKPWQLSAGMNELATEVGRAGLDGVVSPLGLALKSAHRLAMLHALAPPGQPLETTVPDWDALAKPVKDLYTTLGTS
jgi:HD-like signal output (HDOD) protein